MGNGVRFIVYQFFIFLATLLMTNFAFAVIPISSLEELNKIGRDPLYPLDGNYILTQDIDASETQTWPGGFQPIGSSINRFVGVFDGAGYEIKGLYIDRKSDDYVGLFSFVQQSIAGVNGKVINLHLKNCVIKGRSFVGGIVGDLYGSAVLENCVFEGEVYGSYLVGGIAGICANNSVIKKCYSLGRVVCTDYYNVREDIGGLVGFVNSNGLIQNCFSWANVESNVSDAKWLGGLVGEIANNSGIIACYSMGSLPTELPDIGGLVALNSSGSVIESFWDVETSGTSNSNGGIGLTTSEMQSYATYAGLTQWNISDTPCASCATVWSIYDGSSYPFLCSLSNTVPDVVGKEITVAEPEIISAGFNTLVVHEYSNTVPVGYVIDTVPPNPCKSPYYYTVVIKVSDGYAPSIPISTIEELQMIGNDPAYPADNAYHLANDIDATATRYWNGGKGFIPIKNFSGVFSGNGYRIFGLYINNDDNPAMPTGLFSNIVLSSSRNPEIGGVFIENAEVRGIVEVGLLVGRIDVSTHPYPWISSVVAQGQVYGVNKVGGLIGSVNGGVYLSYSSVRVDVNAIPGVAGYDYWYYGGVVGSITNVGATIGFTSYTGNIGGPVESYIGGIVGYANADNVEIYNSHANAYMNNCISWGAYAGGMVGWFQKGSIEKSYAVPRFCAPTGTGVGGLIGDGSCVNVLVNASFWDSEYSGINASACGGTPLTTSEMKTRVIFENAGWDFNGTWGILDGLSYPLLIGEYFRMPSLSWMEIDSAVHLMNEMGVEPTIEDRCSNVVPENYVIDQSILPDVWINPFSTTLTIWRSNGYCPPILISTIEEIQLIGKDSNYPVDGYYVLTQDIDATATSEWNGGQGFEPIFEFRGIFDGGGHIIKNLYINRPSASHAGLFGIVLMGRVYGTYLFNANITGGIYVGGIAGESFGQIIGCGVNGDIATAYDLSYGVGGIVGVNRGIVSTSIAVAEIYGKYNVGGLVGENHNVIDNSYAICNIIGCSEVGGFIGNNYTGDATSQVNNSYSASLITMECMGNYGGFAGKSQPDTCNACFWDMEYSGISFSECGQGKQTAEMYQQSTFGNAGWDFTSVWGIIEGESYPFIITNPIINIQDYAGEPFENVNDNLSSKGIIVQYELVCNDLVPAGSVIDNTFKNKDVPIFHTVYFWVSSGPCTEGEGEGVSEGVLEGTPEGEGIVEGEGISEGGLEGEGVSEGVLEGTPEGEGIVEGEGISEGEGEKPPHSADQNGDWQISLSELLRVVQFFNMQGYHCALPGEESEDGYIPGYEGNKSCTPHASDYNPQDWIIDLSELLRLIQFFNMGGYHPCPEGEDGYCPGQLK